MALFCRLRAGVISHGQDSVGVWLTTLILAACAGCQPDYNPSHYETLVGVVQSIDETGELTVQSPDPLGAARGPGARLCVLTRDSEIYLGGRLGRIASIRPGDPVELVVTRDAAGRVERFAVACLFVRRDLPPPPALRLPTTAPRPAGESGEKEPS